MSTAELTSQRPAATPSKAAPRAWRWVALGLGLSGLVAIAGWGTAGYLYFVTLPTVANAHKVAYSLDLIDRFTDSPAHEVYMQLGDDLKPWWDQIGEMQRQIAAATEDDAREKLIARRDETLIAYIRDHDLADQINLLIGAFAPFDRCLAIDACDDDALRKSISVDVKRIYRTFRPYIESVRASGQPGKDAFGRELEELYFRFVG